VPEEPLPHDGWSGARLTRLVRATDDARFVLKRDRFSDDWICRATRDVSLREARFAAWMPPLPGRVVAPFLGVARDGDGYALLMPDLTGSLFQWEQPIDEPALDRVLSAVAGFHLGSIEIADKDAGATDFPWCPLPERLLLLSRPMADRYASEGLPVGPIFLRGWDAFDRLAPAAARELIDALSSEPGPLLHALARLPSTLLHGDLKLANLGFLPDGRMPLIDWQLVTVGPVAVDMGWFLVSNSADLPVEPEEVMRRYGRERDALSPGAGGDIDGSAGAQEDLAYLVGLLLRGWRKGLDAEAGVVLPSGRTASEDLAWWCDRAVESAGRRLA
jgi:hypothetical protein